MVVGDDGGAVVSRKEDVPAAEGEEDDEEEIEEINTEQTQGQGNLQRRRFRAFAFVSRE